MTSIKQGLYDDLVKIINKNTNGQWINRIKFMRDLNILFEIEEVKEGGHE